MTDSTLPAETHVGRVALRVADPDGVAEFYRSVVGLDVLGAGSERAVLGAGDRPLLVLEGTDAPARGRDEAGLFHTAVRVPDRAALADALERTESGWRLVGASDHGVSEALYLRDPEDNGVEIYRDRPRSEWPTEGGRVRMDTRPLDADALRRVGSGAEGVPAGTDVGHVHLEVTSLPAAREFYVDALGLGVRQESSGALFVAAGDYHHHVGLNVWNRRKSPATGRGLAWFELVVPDRETLTAVRKRLAGAGVDMTAADDGLGIEDGDGFGIEDSDGIGVHITWRS